MHLAGLLRSRRGLIAVLLFALVIIVPCVLLLNHRTNYLLRLGVKRLVHKTGVPITDLEPARLRMRQTTGAGATLPLKDARLVVYKSRREMDFFNGDKLIKTYRVGLGKNPAGQKLNKGDSRTPEGQYYICTRLEPAGRKGFLGLNFPNARDGADGLKRGVIGEREAQAIATAETKKEKPPWNTRLGGAVGLHFIGNGDVSSGCIGLTDDDGAEIFVATGLWTPVEIRP